MNGKTRTRLLQIVPGFHPDVDGLGDFSSRLGDALFSVKGIASHYAVYRQPRTAPELVNLSPHALSYSPGSTPDAFLSHLSQLAENPEITQAVLHYGPYAYSPDGNPLPFATAIEVLSGRIDLLIFFHETYATGAPWKRAFWTAPEQKLATGKMLSIAKAAFTSTELFLHRLEKRNVNHIDLRQIRIFSNVGEPENPKPLDQRERQLVVFGRPEPRLRLYTEHSADLQRICTALQLTSIVDAGAAKGVSIPSRVADIEVIRKGWLPEDAMSDLLAGSVAGVVGYGKDYWEKSGVLAAYQAHRMVPFLVPWDRSHQPAQHDLPFVSTGDLRAIVDSDGSLSAEQAQQFADTAYRQYHEHQSLHRCVEIISPYIDAS